MPDARSDTQHMDMKISTVHQHKSQPQQRHCNLTDQELRIRERDRFTKSGARKLLRRHARMHISLILGEWTVGVSRRSLQLERLQRNHRVTLQHNSETYQQ